MTFVWDLPAGMIFSGKKFEWTSQTYSSEILHHIILLGGLTIQDVCNIALV
jgi:hypothetical protein